MDLRELAVRLEGWDDGDGPLYMRLAEALARRIREGELPPGLRLPSERRLAGALGISRGTVVAAYDRLRAEDLIKSRQGSGTSVAGAAPTVREAGSLSLEALLGMHVVRVGADGTDLIDMTAAAWDDASDLPSDVFEVTDPRFADITSTAGYHPAGIPDLRQAIAEYLTGRGLDSTPEQVLVTCGAHQALSLLMRMSLGPGDVAVTEELTYPGAADTLRAIGARVRVVKVGPKGARIEDLEGALADDPRLVYLIPSVHNPTGAVMPEGARRRVVNLVRGRDTVVVDDESLVETLTEGVAPAPLAAFARDPETISRIFTVGSASKSFWGGLRVGWVRGPEPAIGMLTRLKALADLASGVLSQFVCVRLLEERDGVLERRRQALRERVDVLTGVLTERLPEWTWRRPRGGMSLWVRLPDADARAVADLAGRHGVAFVPGPACSPEGRYTDHLRISLGLHPDKLVEGVRRLEMAWSTYRGGPQRTSTLEVVV